METQKEVYKKMHPEQFSDSSVTKKGKLDRDFLDFYFETLTSKNLEKNFEDFCRKIAEVEICPNLLPQTGPTGGGDSKVDSETYPVSEAISEHWYVGYSDRAATERWAFAISAKKAWKPKVKSDVEKIVKVNDNNGRGYQKIFFMSNQYISDKKRAEAEDELRKAYGLDVRILDRTWLLDKSLKNNKNIDIVIKAFGLSECFKDEKKIGGRDYRRSNELKEIKEQLLSSDLKPKQKVALAQRCVILSRELEVSKQEILDLIFRSEKYAETYGNLIDIADSIYDAAWTVFWWYCDTKTYYDYYKKYEQIAIQEDNVNLFKNLVTLWINLQTISTEDRTIKLNNHTDVLKHLYIQYTNNPSRPNAVIEAKAAYQMVRVLIGEDIDDIINELIGILNSDLGHLDLDLTSLARCINEASIFEKRERSDELFEIIVEKMSNKKMEAEKSMMLIERARNLMESRPYESISYFSRGLRGLYNKDNKRELITTVLEMGYAFEKVGLFWAARNFYYYCFCLCLNQYMKFGEVYSDLFISANCLKFLEVRLGHILYAVQFDALAKITENLYPEKIELSSKFNPDFDYILGMQILRTDYNVEKLLGKLPGYLEERGLVFSSAAMKFELGQHEETVLKLFNVDKEAFDDIMAKCVSHPLSQELKSKPWYGVEPKCTMKTNLLGCSIELNVDGNYEHGEIEMGATILATLESFFSTGIKNKLISLTGKIKIYLHYDPESKNIIQGDIRDKNSNTITISFRRYIPENIIEEQREFSSFTTKLISMVTSIMFPISADFNKIEKMIKMEAAFDRAKVFSNSVFYSMETLGTNMFSYPSILQEYECLPMLRTKKSDITNIKRIEGNVTSTTNGKVIYGKRPDEKELDNISNEYISTSSIINIRLWNMSEFRCVLFISYPNSCLPPALSLAFMKEDCKEIFKEWIKDIGDKDIKNKIGIRIIKGIDKNHPYWYRIAIGENEYQHKNSEDIKMHLLKTRLNTMQPDNDINIKTFENALSITKKFFLCPCYFRNMLSKPEVYKELAILKNEESIIICDACDVKEDDILAVSAILPTDDPIIPLGKEDSVVLKIIEDKKKFHNGHISNIMK